MLARQRQEYILEQVSATGGVRVAEVVAALGISEMTVRRDITELVAQGLTNAEISARHYLSLATVRGVVTQIFDKLGLTNRVQVAIKVHDAGWADD